MRFKIRYPLLRDTGALLTAIKPYLITPKYRCLDIYFITWFLEFHRNKNVPNYLLCELQKYVDIREFDGAKLSNGSGESSICREWAYFHNRSQELYRSFYVNDDRKLSLRTRCCCNWTS